MCRWSSQADLQLPRTLLALLALPPCLVLLAVLFSPSVSLPLTMVSNGTHSFYPTVLLLSLDGFRPDYLSTHLHLLPNLTSLYDSTSRSNRLRAPVGSVPSLGVRAASIQPVFPTLTFPNHWAIMTGLHPESHGIVANDFWDPETGREFRYTEREMSWDSGWWWGEPVWAVVERGGGISANLMW